MLLLVAAVGAILLSGRRRPAGPPLVAGRFVRRQRRDLLALTAAFIKTVANEWPHGIVYVFEHPAAYSVALVGLVGLVIAQHALDAGPVAASQAALLIVNPLSSIVMGIWLFRDHIHTTGSRAIERGALPRPDVLLAAAAQPVAADLVDFEAEQLSDRNSGPKMRAGGSIA